MVQLGKQAIDPPGQARPDLWIIQEMAKRVGPHAPHFVSSLPPEGALAGLGRSGDGQVGAHAETAGAQSHGTGRPLACGYEGEFDGVAEVYDEMRRAMHTAIAGITWERLQRESSVTYPCLSADDPGSPTVFIDHFATDDGRVHLVPADIIPANERPDADFPFVLITGRQLEHWHTGSMTRRATVLDALEPMATASLCGDDLQALGVQAGDVISVRSRRGQVAIHVRRDDGTPRGAVFIPFAYYEAAANLLTNAALDPFGKIPEFKYCAVAVEPGGVLPTAAGYGPAPDAPAKAA
jgi:formate dehydrogenase major subunit